MNSLTSKFSKLGLLVLSFSTLAFAQNINDALRLATPGLGSNARALGMGNSFISLSDDASAAYFNPAGFGLLKRMEFSGGLSYQNAGNTTTFFNESTDYSNSTTRLDRISFAFPFPTTRGSLVFGLSYHNTKDLTGAMSFSGVNPSSSYISNEVSYNSDVMYQLGLSFPVYGGEDNYLYDSTNIGNNLLQSGDILMEGSINNWTFSGAIEIYKNLYVGANLNIISGNYSSNNNYYEDDNSKLYEGLTDPTLSDTRNFQYFHQNSLLDWDISGWNLKTGILYQLKNNMRFGLTIQFPKNYSIEENFEVNSESFYGDYSENHYEYNQSDKIKYDIISPYELSAGFSVNLAGLIVSAEGTLIDYSQTEFDGEGDGLSKDYIADQNKNIKDQLTAVLNYNLGLEYTIPTVGLRVRGGFMAMPSAYKDDDSEFDKKYFTAGVGFLTDETIGIDLGYAHGWWNDIGDNYGSNVSRTNQEITTDKVIITATYRF